MPNNHYGPKKRLLSQSIVPKNTKRLNLIVISLLYFGLISTFSFPAHAYIDPGTGSALVYIVTGIVVSLYFAFRSLLYKFVELIFRSRQKQRRCELAIHSEDPRYEIVFLPVLRGLSELEIETTFFTMYERDSSFEPLPPHVIQHSIPSGLLGYSYLNHLEAKMLVTTTPQLDVMTFGRSKKVSHYCNIQHALGESRYSRPFAYDYFDSVMCCGPMLMKNLRKLEEIRNIPKKVLLETGIPHYDDLINNAEDKRILDGPKNVLIAPSWGPMSLFQVFGTDFVRSVAKKYNVTVRPHPQMKTSQKKLYNEILSIENIEVDLKGTPAHAMSKADILVSEISGIMHEFAFIYNRPVIVLDHNVGLEALEGYYLHDSETLLDKCRDFIISLPPIRIHELCDVIESCLDLDLHDRIRAVREELVFNWNCAGITAARQIEELIKCL